MEQKDTYYVPSLQQTVDAGEFANQRDVEIAALKKLAGKNNNAFVMGMRNLDRPISIGMFDRYIEKKAKESGIAGSSVWEAVKGFGEGVGKAPAKYAGYFASNALPLIAKSATTLYAFSGAAGTKESADKFVREANKGIEAWAKEMQRITGIEDAGIVESTVGNALGSVSAGIMGGGFSAPMFGLSAAQDTYTRQVEEGVGMGEAAARAIWHGTGEWYLEKLQLNRIFGALAKKSKPAAIIKDLLENALQEGAQQFNEQLANWNIDKRDYIEKLQEIGLSMAGGAIASLAGSVGGNILNRKTIDEVGDLMRRNGKSDEEIQKVKNELNKIVDTNELEQAANEVAKDELTTAALTFKEQAQFASEELVKGLEDTIARNELVDIGGEIQGWKTEEMKPMYQLGELQIDTQKNPHLGMVLYQAEQAGQPMETLAQVLEWTKGKIDTEEAQKLATGIGAVYTKTLEQLKSFGQNEELADKNAHIRAAAAFSLAKNFNMTVEKADEMLGGITSKKADEFEGNILQGKIADNNGSVELSINTAEEMKDMSEDNFKQKMLETLWSFKNDKIHNDSLGADIEIRTSSIKKYKSFFADKNKRLIVPYIPELLKKANFNKVEESYMQPKETNVKAYYKADIGIDIDENFYNVHLTVKEDNHGHLFWDAQVQEKSPSAGPATNPGVKGQSDNSLSDSLIITPSETNVKPKFQNGVDKDFYATHNVDRGGLKEALKLGGFAMPSFAVRRIGHETNNQFGEITLVGNRQLATPSRSVEVYDRDAWSPSIAQALRYDLSPKGNTFIKDILKKHNREREFSTFQYNIVENIKDPSSNGMAMDLYAIDKGLSEERSERRGLYKDPDYLDWYEKNIFENAEPYLWTENDANTDMIRRKFTLQNMMKYLRKQERSGGGWIGDFPDAGRLLQYFAYKFPSLKEMKSKKENITTRQDQYEKTRKLDEEFFELSEEIKKEGQEYDFYDGGRELAYALVSDKGIKDSLERGNMKSDEETIKKIEAFREKLKNVATDYFEAKPRRIVGIEEFSGAILPNTKEYDDIAQQLSDRGLSVKRVEKGNTEQQTKALNEIQSEKPNVFFQRGEQSPFGAYYNNTIYLFENANESTFVHEMSHAYMDVLEILAQSGNTKAQKDLGVIRSWLKKKDGEAFTQADWERFARGFEMYIREGKAPNEYLGGKNGVFARFRNWLLGIYGGMKALTVKNEKGKNEPVRINNQIRQFYNEMLGGSDIDQVLNTAIENKQAMSVVENKLNELAEAQQKLAEEKAKIVREMANNVKPDTMWANIKDYGNNLWESITELPKFLLKSSSERLAKIDKRLGILVQRVEQSQGLHLKKWADQIKSFYEAFNKLSAEDKAKVQFYLLNQQWGDVADLVGEENTNAVKDLLQSIYQELIDSGVEVGYRDDYFPRSVLDYDGLLEEMGLTYPSLRKEMESAIGKDATPQEQAEWLDKHIMGFKGNVSLNSNRNTKERKLDLITDRMAKYYKPSMETLVDYMNGMAKLLSMREAFGRDIEYKEGDKESAEDSIGKIINNLFGDNKLSKKEIDEVREVLSALYLPNGSAWKIVQALRQYGYATKLSFSTTVRQFADIGMMMKVNGVLNTLEALFHPDQRLSLETLGIDPLGEEFRTSDKDIGGKIANIFTKWKGINWADAVMKNAYIRGNYKALQKLAKNSDKFHQKYDALFGDETEKIRKDLLEDKISEPVNVLLFHEISKIQPISRSAMPTAYLNNPNGRSFYMFKTFSLHRAEYMISELAEDFRTKNYKKAGKDIMADVAVIGWEGLVELLIAFLKYGWQAMATEAVLETFAGSGLGVFGLNKHQALQLSRGQFGDFLQEMAFFGTPVDDIVYLIRHYDDDDKLLRAFLPDMILEPLIVGPKEIK